MPRCRHCSTYLRWWINESQHSTVCATLGCETSGVAKVNCELVKLLSSMKTKPNPQPFVAAFRNCKTEFALGQQDAEEFLKVLQEIIVKAMPPNGIDPIQHIFGFSEAMLRKCLGPNCIDRTTSSTRVTPIHGYPNRDT